MSPAPWVAHFGLTRTPFGKSIPAKDLFARQAHAEAIARINFCVVESALGWSPATSGRARPWPCAPRWPTPGPDPTPDHLHRQPRLRHPGLYCHHRPGPGRHAPLPQGRADGPSRRPARRRGPQSATAGSSCNLTRPISAARPARGSLGSSTNADLDSASPFAGILVGQPTLNRQLRMGIFAALDQRIATRFTIKPMDLAESAAYLRHHLALAGRDDPLFADDAIARLHRVANGLPRALNNAATAALIAAAAAGKDLVDDACAKKAVAELTRD